QRDADGRARWDRPRSRSGRTGRLRPLRGGARQRATGAGFARRCARHARGGPRVPDAGRCLRRGADPHVDRLQARDRGRRRPPTTASSRIRVLLRLFIRELRQEEWEAVASIYAEGIATRNATFDTEVPSWEAWDG